MMNRLFSHVHVLLTNILKCVLIMTQLKSQHPSSQVPIVLLRKHDGSARLCVDDRRINKVIIKDHLPLPLIEDQLDRLQKAKIFSTIDLKIGFC